MSTTPSENSKPQNVGSSKMNTNRDPKDPSQNLNNPDQNKRHQVGEDDKTEIKRREVKADTGRSGEKSKDENESTRNQRDNSDQELDEMDEMEELDEESSDLDETETPNNSNKDRNSNSGNRGKQSEIHNSNNGKV